MKKLADRVFLICAAMALLAVPALTLARMSTRQALYYENRTLADKPVWDWEAVLEGDWFSGWEEWYSDRVPGRNTLLRLTAKVDLDILKRPVVNSVVVGGDKLLPFLPYGRWDTRVYQTRAEPLAEDLAAFSRRVEELGGRFWFVGIPEQGPYFYDHYPAEMENRRWDTTAANSAFYQALESYGVAYLDMEAVYDAQGRPEEYYSAVDHHYRWRGALAAYEAVMDRINGDTGLALPVTREGDLNIRTLPNPYLGSRNRKLYGLWPSEERAEIGEPKVPVPFTREDDGQESEAEVYALPGSEEQLVTYGLYMGGDHGETVIRTNRPELPNALIFGDSFTNAMETLLYTSFNETRSLDLRYYEGKSLREYVEEYRPEVVLCVRDNTAFYTPGGNGQVWTDEPSGGE